MRIHNVGRYSYYAPDAGQAGFGGLGVTQLAGFVDFVTAQAEIDGGGWSNIVVVVNDFIATTR